MYFNRLGFSIFALSAVFISLGADLALAKPECIQFYSKAAIPESYRYSGNEPSNLPTLPYRRDKGSFDSFVGGIGGKIVFTKDARETSEVVYKGSASDVADKFRRSVLVWGKVFQSGQGEGAGYSRKVEFTFPKGVDGSTFTKDGSPEVPFTVPKELWKGSPADYLFNTPQGLRDARMLIIHYLDDLGRPTVHVFKSPELYYDGSDLNIYSGSYFYHRLIKRPVESIRVIEGKKILGIKAYFWSSGNL